MDGSKQTIHSDTNEGVISGAHVRLLAEPAPIPVPHAGEPQRPQVHVVQEGGVIRAIDVVCPCGERIRLRCVY